MSIVSKLYQAFKNIEFNEEDHIYIDRRDGFKYTSVTTLKKEYQPPVDWEYWKVYKLLQRIGAVKYRKDLIKHRCFEFEEKIIEFEHASDLVDIAEITREWKEKADKGTQWGSYVHKYIEDGFKNKFPKDRLDSVDEFILYKGREMSPIGLEVVVGDREIGLAGQFDGLFYNKKRKLILRDTKTDTEFKKAFEGARHLPPFDKVLASTMGGYQIQLSLYKHIIEYNTSVKIDAMYIDHFNKDMLYTEYKVPAIKIDYEAFRRNLNTKRSNTGA